MSLTIETRNSPTKTLTLLINAMINVSSFSIRPAAKGDAELLGHIGTATFIETYTDQIDGQAMIAHCTHQHARATYDAYLDHSQTGCWIAEHSQTRAPIGYALNCIPDLPVPSLLGDIELKRIYVLSKYHGQGIAGALMDACLAHASTANAPRLLLGTYEANFRALAFYAKHRFETIGTRKFTVGHKTYDDIVMARTLIQV